MTTRLYYIFSTLGSLLGFDRVYRFSEEGPPDTIMDLFYIPHNWPKNEFITLNDPQWQKRHNMRHRVHVRFQVSIRKILLCISCLAPIFGWVEQISVGYFYSASLDTLQQPGNREAGGFQPLYCACHPVGFGCCNGLQLPFSSTEKPSYWK